MCQTCSSALYICPLVSFSHCRRHKWFPTVNDCVTSSKHVPHKTWLNAALLIMGGAEKVLNTITQRAIRGIRSRESCLFCQFDETQPYICSPCDPSMKCRQNWMIYYVRYVFSLLYRCEIYGNMTVPKVMNVKGLSTWVSWDFYTISNWNTLIIHKVVMQRYYSTIYWVWITPRFERFSQRLIFVTI